MDLAQEARINALYYLLSLIQFILLLLWTLTNSSNQSIQTHDFSGTSSARPSKMGQGENRSLHCPLLKMLLRSKDDPRKSSANKNAKKKIYFFLREGNDAFGSEGSYED